MIGRLVLPSEPLKPDVAITPFFALVFALIVLAIVVLSSPFRFGAANEVAFRIESLGSAEEQVKVGAPANGTVRIAARVETDRKGTIKTITVRDLDSADAPKPLGANVSELKKELSRLREELRIRPMRLIFEMDANLPYVRVVEMLDIGTLAGYADIAPIMIPHDRIDLEAAVDLERIPDKTVDLDRK